MKRILVLLVTIGLIGLFGSVAFGGDMGARAAAMGGAYTAVADDGTAPYWNPAGITQVKVFTLTPAFGIQGDVSTIFDLLDGNAALGGFYTMGSAIVGVTTKYVAINCFGDFSAIGIGDGFGNWVGVGEGLGYGTVTIAGTFDNLALGINLKKFQDRYAFVTSDGIDQATLSASGDGMAFDLGALYHVRDNFKVGLMARNISANINWGEVSYDESGTPLTPPDILPSSLPKTYVIGLAYYPYDSLLIAADYEKINGGINGDLNRVHLGLEQRLLWNAIALRLGVFTNQDQPNGVSAGLGLKLGPVVLDLAAQKAEEAAYFLSAGFKF